MSNRTLLSWEGSSSVSSSSFTKPFAVNRKSRNGSYGRHDTVIIDKKRWREKYACTHSNVNPFIGRRPDEPLKQIKRHPISYAFHKHWPQRHFPYHVQVERIPALHLHIHAILAPIRHYSHCNPFVAVQEQVWWDRCPHRAVATSNYANLRRLAIHIEPTSKHRYHAHVTR